MASRKYGESVGSPPENWIDICRRGFTSAASSRILVISSHDSSCTYPTWFASMKHGSHIMLQRLVRSTVSTAPRPYLMVLEPWSWIASGVIRTSRPPKRRSIRERKRGSTAITSSKRPCSGQVFSITTCPSRSTIRARISPGLSVISRRQSASPRRTTARASFTHVGQRLSVSLGQPSGGRSRSAPRGMGWSLQRGWKGPPACAIRFTRCIKGHAALAEDETIFSRMRTGSMS